jgi:hypothetical protein
VLTVDAGADSVRVGGVLVAVEHLNLVVTHHEDAAVAAPLAVADDFRGRRELEVELTVAHRLRALDAPASRGDLHVAALHGPACLAAAHRLPVREVGPVEQDDRVGRGRARHALRALCRRADDARLGTPGVVPRVRRAVD